METNNRFVGDELSASHCMAGIPRAEGFRRYFYFFFYEVVPPLPAEMHLTL
jgi:hypothetical protein